MKTRVAYGLICVGVSALLAACGKFDFFGDREPWRDAAEARCLRAGELQPSAFAEPMPSIRQKGACGLENPFRISALLNGEVSIQPPAKIGCPMNSALNKWMREVVQPAAFANYGMPVTGIKNIASYGCRTRNNQRGAPLSEHAFGNALDIKAFFLADGRVIDVRTSWNGGSPHDRAFLRQAHGGACGTFKTVLGPGSDGFHEDHFHLDLARHDSAGVRAYCRPLPQRVPSVPPDQQYQKYRQPAPPHYQPYPYYDPPEVSQQPDYYRPPQPDYAQPAYSPPQAYPPQPAYQPEYQGYPPGPPMSYAPASTWPIARVPTPYAAKAEDAFDR